MHSSVYSFGWSTLSGHSSILAEKCSIHPDGQPYRDTHLFLQNSVIFILMANHIGTLIHSCRVVFYSFWWPTISGHSSILHSSVYSFWWPIPYLDTHTFLQSSVGFILMANHFGTFIRGRKFEPQSGHITFAEIDHEIILRPFSRFRWFKKDSCQLLSKVTA